MSRNFDGKALTYSLPNDAFVTGKPVKIDGPATLYRFSGPQEKGTVDGSGDWWISERTYLDMYNEARKLSAGNNGSTVSTEFIKIYRDRLAVSLDWNDLQRFFRMNIPAGGYVDGIIGVTSRQPKLSYDDQYKQNREVKGIYKGGAEQVFVRYTAAEWTVREKWIIDVSF